MDSQPMLSDPENPSDAERAEMGRRLRVIRREWTPEERERRKFARVSYKYDNGLYIPPLKKCPVPWQVPESGVLFLCKCVFEEDEED